MGNLLKVINFISWGCGRFQHRVLESRPGRGASGYSRLFQIVLELFPNYCQTISELCPNYVRAMSELCPNYARAVPRTDAHPFANAAALKLSSFYSEVSLAS